MGSEQYIDTFPQEPFSCNKLPSVSVACVLIFFFRSIKSVCFFIQEQKQNVLYFKKNTKVSRTSHNT